MKQLARSIETIPTAPMRERRVESAIALVPAPFTQILQTPLLALEPIHMIGDRIGDSCRMVAVNVYIKAAPPQVLPNARKPDAATLASDLGSLLTLASGRRMHSPPTVALRMEGSEQRTILAYGGALDYSLSAPLPAGFMSKAYDILVRLPSLSPDDLDVLSAAAHLHYGSVLTCESDPAAAYVLLVAGLEVLSQQYGVSQTSWALWDQSPSWDAFFSANELTDSQAQAIREKLLTDKQMRLKLRFRRYVTDSVADTFWQSSIQQFVPEVRLPEGSLETPKPIPGIPMSSILPDRNVLERAVARSYDLRSGIVHRGAAPWLFDLALRPGAPLDGRQPLPYPILRMLLSTLLLQELRNRSTPIVVPDDLF